MKAVLIGNYGVGNFGDEALREYFLSTFPDVEWRVLSAHPTRSGELPRLPLGLRSLFGTPWWKAIGALRRADAVVFGGGTLFTDAESVWACVLWGFHAFVAHIFGVPVLLAFQGIGPFRTTLGKGIARWVVRRATYISVRDEVSETRIGIWVMNTKIVQTYDPIFSSFISQKIDHRAQNVCMLIPRHNSGISFEKTLNEHATDIQGMTVEILSFQPSDVGEQQVIAHLHDRYPTAVVRHVESVADLMLILARASYCVSERFHGALAAVAAEVPLIVVSQAEGDKLSQVARLSDPTLRAASLQRIEEGERTLREALRAA